MLLVVSTDSSGISDFVSKYRKYFTGAFISALTLTLSFTIDTILAKSILTTDIASQYIGLATLAKLFLFTSLALSTIVFPYIIDPKHRDIQKRLTMYFLLFILTAGVACFLITQQFSIILVPIILGAQYLPMANTLPLITLTIVAATFTALLSQLSSLLGIHGFLKPSLISVLFGIALYAILFPIYTIQSFTIWLSSIFALYSILLYNLNIRKHFKAS
jgi:O-antigen/teichoic acid export membrane protein